MKTVFTEAPHIKQVTKRHADGIMVYHMVTGHKLYQGLIYFRAAGNPMGSVRSFKRLHGTMTACNRYRARVRQRLGDCTI